MGSFVGGMLEGLRSAYCSYLASMPDWQKNWRRVTAVPGLKDYNDFMVGVMCNRPPEPTDYPAPKVGGGQCPGVAYSVAVTWQTPQSNPRGCAPPGGSTYSPRTGPITRYDEPYGDGGLRSGINHAGGKQQIMELPAWAFEYCPSAGLKEIVCTRIDGLSDDCGDDDFEPEPFEPTTINIDLDVNYGPSNEFNLTVPVVIAPVYIAFDGTVNVPVTFDISPEISLEGTWTLFPDAKLELNFPTSPTEEPPGSTGDDDPPPEDPGEDDPDGGSEDDPDAPGKPDEPEEPEERIHFLIVRAVVNSEARPSTVHQNVAPSLYVPRLGSARFGTTVDGVTFWTSDIDIKGLNSIIECPIPWGATRFAVDAAPGVALNYAPVSADPQLWPQYLQIGATYTDDRR